MRLIKPIGAAAFAAALSMGTLAAADTQAATLEISVENMMAEGGLTLSPVWFGFHDGSYDAFNAGAAAGADAENAAELGSFGAAAAAMTAADGNAKAALVGAPGGFPPLPVIEPGEAGSATIDLDPLLQRFATFLSMVVPSNDAFIGNDAALEVFDAGGAFLGPIDLLVLGGDIWDAGTEANDPNNGPAFVPGQDAAQGAAEGGVVHRHSGLLAFAGLLLPNGQTLNGDLIDFARHPELRLARIRIDLVDVPEPAPFGLLLLGGLTMFGLRRRQGRFAAA